jgi:hypothetical protein
MPRFSIFKAMLLVALVAGNFAAVRSLDPKAEVPGILTLLMTGLLPLVDAQIIGLYLIARRYRFVVKKRTPNGNGLGVVVFSLFNAFALIFLFALCFAAPDQLAVGLDYVFGPFGALFRSMGYEGRDFEAPYFQFFVIPLIAAMLLSGPALLLGLTIGRFTNGFELLVTLRAPTTQIDGESQ